jgi:23S rRNA (uracil1939-C5)-methyltransferase
MKGQPQQAEITGLSHDGRGIAHVNGKCVFISNALPGETVNFQYTHNKSKYAEAQAIEIIQAAEQRAVPKCKHFTVCGGCSMQHLSPEGQIAFKQQTLLEQLQHFGNCQPQAILPPLTAYPWQYRHKARLGVKYVVKKGKLLIGFREKDSRYLADIDCCEVLHPRMKELLPGLQNLIASLEQYDKIAQVEVAAGDEAIALVLRNLMPLSEQDNQKLKSFAAQHGVWLYLQPKGPATAYKLWPEDGVELLTYRLSDISYAFHPLDFTQVNPAINKQMLDSAIQLLDLQASDKVLDLFCGLGNFTLPIAKQCAQVVGVEGDELMVNRAKRNAELNHIANVSFYRANLAEPLSNNAWVKERFNKILLDPPRSGALEIIPELAKLRAEKIVYVSCNPATLARDAGLLTEKFGYTLLQAGVMDMFPHTSHVESIALFGLNKKR